MPRVMVLIMMEMVLLMNPMKKTQLEDILQALKNPSPEQIIELNEVTINKARISLDEMFRLAE